MCEADRHREVSVNRPCFDCHCRLARALACSQFVFLSSPTSSLPLLVSLPSFSSSPRRSTLSPTPPTPAVAYGWRAAGMCDSGARRRDGNRCASHQPLTASWGPRHVAHCRDPGPLTVPLLMDRLLPSPPLPGLLHLSSSHMGETVPRNGTK